jgi:hypothetical protein
MAEFRIELRNTGEVPLTNFRIVDTYEMTLEPELASEGVDDAQPGQLVWTLERLEPGQAYHLRVQCRCLDVSARACNRVTVECDQRPPIVGEACLQILPAQEAAGPQPPADVQPSPSDVQPPTGVQRTPPDPPPPTGAQASRLQLSIADFFDPVRVGGEARYRIFVENPGTMADQNVTLTIRFPTELRPGNIEAPSGVQSQIEGQTIRFQPVAEIRAGETITFTIPFTAQQAGRAEIVAELSSDRLARPLSVQEQTEILPQQ